jgi:hypothetical protein
MGQFASAMVGAILLRRGTKREKRDLATSRPRTTDRFQDIEFLCYFFYIETSPQIWARSVSVVCCCGGGSRGDHGNAWWRCHHLHWRYICKGQRIIQRTGRPNAQLNKCGALITPPITPNAKLIVTLIPSHVDSWDAWSQLELMVNQYAGAPESKMKNTSAIWSNTVVEDAGMIVSTAQFWHRCLSGCEECAPPVCAVEADY